MPKAIIELIDQTDLAEYANEQPGIELGEIPMEFETVMDEDFINTVDGVETAGPDRIAYASSNYLGLGGFFTAEQGLTAVLSCIADCLANQEDGYTSEFIIPVSATDRIYIAIRIGETF